MTRALSRKFHEAKARNRIALDEPEYPVIPDPDRLFKRITLESFWHNGNTETNVVEVYPSRGHRKDRYRVLVNGKPWRDPVSWTDLLAGLRKSR